MTTIDELKTLRPDDDIPADAKILVPAGDLRDLCDLLPNDDERALIALYKWSKEETKLEVIASFEVIPITNGDVCISLALYIMDEDAIVGEGTDSDLMTACGKAYLDLEAAVAQRKS